MKPYVCRAGAIAAVAIVVGTSAAGVLPVSYLTPDRFAVPLDGQVSLRIEAGTPTVTQTVAWPSDKLAWFFVRADGTQENRDNLAVAVGQKNSSVPLTIAQPGVTMLGYNTKPAVLEIAAADFKGFLTHNVARPVDDPALRELDRQQKVRVRRLESGTTLVRVPESNGRQPEHSAIATSKTGQIAEVQPVFDPTLLAVGRDLPLRLHLRGVAQAGVRVQATSVAAGKTTTTTTDAAGTTHFAITDAGVWRIEFHVAERLAGDPEADWVLYSGALTFEVATEGGK